jgi:hypothetical protein
MGALLGAALVVMASSCGQSASSAKAPTASVASSAAATASLSPGSPPPGGPVPAQLLGNWYLPPAAYMAINGYDYPCPSPATAANCFFELTLTATTYSQVFSAIGGKQDAGQGDVVVNNHEIDFFNGVLCGLALPDGVGRYTWTLIGGVLHLALISDPCPRQEAYIYQGWTRTP